MLDPQAFPYVTLVVILVVAAGGGAMFLVESSTEPIGIQDALWWAVATVTTVGYGDFVPHSLLGRCVAVVVMLVGITFASLLTANLAAHLTRRRDRQAQDDGLARPASVSAPPVQVRHQLAAAGARAWWDSVAEGTATGVTRPGRQAPIAC